jgi:DNA-binding NtrC family response regulator
MDAPETPMTPLGEAPQFRAALVRAERAARSGLPVLLRGETGTGKEVVARRVHEASGRSGAFVAVDCAALAAGVVESELFGHVRGAFTGATSARDGLVASADGGTLFLDEIGELDLDVQTRLLRLAEASVVRPVGGERERKVDVRIVAATWRDLADLVDEGRFRADLYHRLAVVEVELPALRDRGGDALLLFDAFLADEAAQLGRDVPRVGPSARAHLARWPWPGNVREVRNVARYVAAMARGEVGFDDLPKRLRAPATRDPSDGVEIRTDLPYLEARREWLDAFQERYVVRILEEHGGNVSEAARAAQMDRRSIQRVLARLGRTGG